MPTEKYYIGRGQRLSARVLCLVAALALLVAATLLLYTLGYRCPTRALLGRPCPGCGMTTAMARFAVLDLPGAAAAHPLYLLPPLLAVGLGGVYLSGRLTARLLSQAAVAAVVLLLSSWFAQLI